MTDTITKVLSSVHLTAMLKALKSHGNTFTVKLDTSAETCVVTHVRSDTEVLKALKTPAGWMITHHAQLFV